MRAEKKNRSKRGYNRGRGNGKRARGAGNRGGRGRAGLGKRAAQNKLKALRCKNLGKSGTHGFAISRPSAHGFVSVKQRKNFAPDTINVGQLDQLASKINKMELDLPKMGYTKLLGSGKVTNKLTVNVPLFSKIAKEKLEAAGGTIINK